MVADSGLMSFDVRASPSTVRCRTVNPDAPAALIPMSGGITIDHSPSRRTPLYGKRSHGGTRCDTETGPAMRCELVKERLAMNLAEMEAATKFDKANEHAVHQTEVSARRVSLDREQPLVVNAINAPTNQAGVLQRKGVADNTARATLPDRAQPGSSTRREHSSERERGLIELADVINKLARPRLIPRQVYEQPAFHGNVDE
ncbi:hypothetical protein EVAR_57740_1 [Eumeta japonica]|uniref:Uncharacterized protein n=1 Tax=Eumeta variegata TaxID=151549 RepID=A0A4C1YA61_EUMVA|nr:hypothetical protein EVAR_57740_1 [Eumeta japonica]